MFSLQRLWAIAWKELMVLFFNKVSRILIIVPPLAQIVIFGWAATMEVRNVSFAVLDRGAATMEVRNVSFAVLDRDRGLGAERVVGAVLGSPTFVRMVQVADEAEMRSIMDRGDVLFTLVFDSNFSRDLEAGRNASMQILLDGRRSNAAQIACHYVTNITSTLLAQGAAPGVVVRNWFNPNLEFQWFFLPNLIGILTFMLGLVVTGLTVAREREVGTFDQLLVTPSTPTEIALAKLVPGCVTGLIHGTLFLLISVFGFGIPFAGSLILLYVSLLVFALASGGLGLMVSSLCQTQQQAILGAFTIGVPCILIIVPPLAQIVIFGWAATMEVRNVSFAVLDRGCGQRVGCRVDVQEEDVRDFQVRGDTAWRDLEHQAGRLYSWFVVLNSPIHVLPLFLAR